MTRRQYLKTIHNSDNENGFDYQSEGNIMKKNVSPALYNNVKIAGFLNALSNIMVHVINHVKNIKKSYMYGIDIDNNDFN